MRSIVFAGTGAVAALLCLTPLQVGAQQCAATGIIVGTTRTMADLPVPSVQLVVEGAAAVRSDSAGRFRIAGACAGDVVVTARRLGFQVERFPLRLAAGETLAVNIMLEATAIALDPVVVTARESASARRLREFYIRRQRSSGHFLTREDIEPYDGRRFTDMLRTEIPGVRVVATASMGRVRIRNARCAPMVWIDGMSTPAGEYDVDVLQTSGIAAVEVYAGPATIPAEFRTPFGRDGCGGAIVVWTRVGPDQWDRPRRRDLPRAEDVAAELPVYRAEDVDELARVDSARMTWPSYPDSLYAFGIEGTAVAEFVVDTSGRPVHGTVKVLSATAPGFEHAVIRAVSVSRFFPARKDDRPVRQVMTLPFRFTVTPQS